MYTNIDNKIISGEYFDDIINSSLTKKSSTFISFVNPFSYMAISSNEDVINGVDYLFADGAMLCKFHGLFFKEIGRASFDYSSIASSFFQLLQSNKKSVAIVGAKSSELIIAIERIQMRFPELNIIYSHDGYIAGKERKVLDNLDTIKPDVILIGMGSPLQERYSHFLKSNLSKPTVIITCGGFLTQTSIKEDYYLPIVKRLGLRWLQRMVLHSHVRKRVIKDYPRFVMKYLINHISLRNQPHDKQ